MAISEEAAVGSDSDVLAENDRPAQEACTFRAPRASFREAGSCGRVEAGHARDHVIEAHLRTPGNQEVDEDELLRVRPFDDKAPANTLAYLLLRSPTAVHFAKALMKPWCRVRYGATDPLAVSQSSVFRRFSGLVRAVKVMMDRRYGDIERSHGDGKHDIRLTQAGIIGTKLIPEFGERWEV